MEPPLEVIRRYPAHDFSLNGLLASRVRLRAQHPLLSSGTQSWSYAAFAARVDAAARALHARGIAAGERVGVMATNSPNMVVLLFALARLGAIFVPVNPAFGAREAGTILQHAGVRAVGSTPSSIVSAREAVAPLRPAPWFFLLDGAHERLEWRPAEALRVERARPDRADDPPHDRIRSREMLERGRRHVPIIRASQHMRRG